MRFVVVVVLITLVSSCGPAAKLRRAEKLIKKAEEQGAVWHVDSVRVEITVPVPQVRVDTVAFVLPGDTVVVEKDRLKVIVRRLAGDTIRVEAECKADTIKVRVTKTVTKTLKATGGIKWWWLLIAVAGGMILGAIVRLVR